ncbi:Thioredoxin [Holotrichia oblita]|nr:Thioredoxin [Holotrichia oblita]
MAKVITQENFEQEVTNSQKPVLVDFWAEWCGPCRMIAPIVESLSETMADKISVGKVNVDEQEALARKFGVMSIPTLILFKNGKNIGTVVGYKSKEGLEQFVNSKI